jgi:hypothetical protein
LQVRSSVCPPDVYGRGRERKGVPVIKNGIL